MLKYILIGFGVLMIAVLLIFILGACKVAGEYDEASERDFQRFMEQQAKLEEKTSTEG